VFRLPDGSEAVLERLDTPSGRYALRFTSRIDDAWLERRGHVPLPPYIRREDAPDDDARYQTVYARDYGSTAAPTAGLHFTEALLAELRERGIGTAFISLHVGPGTFLPVRSSEVEGHRMHTEAYHIGEEAAARIEEAKRSGRKVVACGTTALRAMEAAWRGGSLERGCGRSDIFIYGDYRFRTADALFTNFHTPASTLLMLVCAFAGGAAGRPLVLDAYREAVAAGYRFFSYGDAMLLV
jgi:S-adenosylmethionine:tRNA ribosyltransferase-isomerase